MKIVSSSLATSGEETNSTQYVGVGPMIAKMMAKGNGPGEHPMIDAAFGTLVLPGTSLAGEAAVLYLLR